MAFPSSVSKGLTPKAPTEVHPQDNHHGPEQRLPDRQQQWWTTHFFLPVFPCFCCWKILSKIYGRGHERYENFSSVTSVSNITVMVHTMPQNLMCCSQSSYRVVCKRAHSNRRYHVRGVVVLGCVHVGCGAAAGKNSKSVSCADGIFLEKLQSRHGVVYLSLRHHARIFVIQH